jgi:REP element-mobilizing transposase RayT
MPEHVHLFVRGNQSFVLTRWITILKQVLGKTVVRAALPNDPVWQRGFFDHVLRSNESYSEKWNYVRENPVRAGLGGSPEEWPYAGEIITIDRA